MDWSVAGPYIVATLALIGTCITALMQRRTAHETHQVAEAAHIIMAYDQLCKTLRSELAAKGEEIDRLRLRITEIEKREAEWATEKQELLERIRKLEDERNQLKALLDDLYEQSCGKKE